MSFGGCPLSYGSIYIISKSWLAVEVTISRFHFVPRTLPSFFLAGWFESVLEKKRRANSSDCRIRKERRRAGRRKREARKTEMEKEERFLFRDIEGGYDPCRLFVIVICITMDETWIMGSWDLRSEHDEKEGKRNPLCSALCNRHASAFDRYSKYCRSQFVMLYVKKKILKYYSSILARDVCFCINLIQ